jgi:hypothetical protein
VVEGVDRIFGGLGALETANAEVAEDTGVRGGTANAKVAKDAKVRKGLL